MGHSPEQLTGSGRSIDIGAEERPRGVAMVESAAPEAAEFAPAPSGGDARGADLLEVLRNRHFRTIWIASFGCSIGNWMELIGVQWIVAERTGDLTWMGYIASAQLAPTLFLGLLGGVVADSVNRRTLLVCTQFVMMLIALALAAAAWFDRADPYVLLVLSLAQGITTAFNAPAWQVLAPRLVPREQLTRAVTLQGLQFNAARVLGPALGGYLMHLSFFGHDGVVTLFLVNAVSFVGVMAAVLTTPDAPAPPERRGQWRNLRGLWSESIDALRHVMSHTGLRAVFLASAIFAIFATPILRFLPMFVQDVYFLKEAAYGNLVAVMGGGAVLGGLALGYIPHWYPKHHLIPLSMLLGAASILAFSVTSSVVLAGAFMFLVGLFWMWTFNSCASAMQLLVEDSRRGRVWAVSNTIALGLMPVGSLVAGFIGEAGADIVHRVTPELWSKGLESQIGLGVVAALLIIVGIVMLIWRTPEVDGLKPGDPGFERRPGFMLGITASTHRPGRRA